MGQQQMIAMYNNQNQNINGPGSVYNNNGISPSSQHSHSHQSGMSMAALNQMQQIQQAQIMKQMQQIQQQQQQSPHNQQQSSVKMFSDSAHPYHTLNVHSPKIFQQQSMSDSHSSDIAIQNKMHSSLVQLLSTGSIMTKYPSIHTETVNYLMELNKMKCKYKLVRISADWQTIEFHNILQNSDQSMMPLKGKPPKVLPIGNMKHIDSSFNDSNSIFSKSKHSLDLYIYALDKNGKEIVIKLICQNINDTKRWTRALNQIINHFKH